LQQGHTGTEEDFLEWLSGQGQIDAKIEEVYETIAREYVRKVIGMGLSQNDFTNILKAKLESLENYDDTQVRALITSLTNRLDTLVDGDVTQAIESFNEVIAFLDGLSDTQNLAEIITSIQSEIAGKADAATTYTKTEADTKFATNETVNGAAFLEGESGSSTTANFDPQTDTIWNIPQVLGSSAKAQARANIGAQETLVSGTNVKTVNNESILGQGNITIQGSGEANVIETVKVNGTALTPDANKAVDITVPAAQIQSDWNQTTTTAKDYIKNKPTIPAAQVQSDWNATSGMGVILNKPTIPAAQVNADWNASSGVAQILNKPTIPTVTGKADKVSNATNGHLAGLDANGNLTDSGFKIVVTDETTYEGMTKDSNTIYLITES
jgi:hypothetical protein